MQNARCLFILKRREDYGVDLANFSYPSVASGMFNSATFVSNYLEDLNYDSKVIIVTDNNSIDKEVKAYKPTHVFIEGYWVVPEKFTILKQLHPRVKWIVRCHSELPFLAQEGIAIEWTTEYLKQGVIVAPNSPRMQHDFEKIYQRRFTLLPNYYPTEDFTTREIIPGEVLHISCFGAIRPMKNHLNQAVAAIAYADELGKKLCFHVNAGRVEMQGANSLKNLKSIFAARPEHSLVEHSWASHEDFLQVLKGIDVAMQCSFTESFNIVTADALSVGTPVLVSSEVPFVSPLYADPTSTKDMQKKLAQVQKNYKSLIEASRKRLKEYDLYSGIYWTTFLAGKVLCPSDDKFFKEKLLAQPAKKNILQRILAHVKKAIFK